MAIWESVNQWMLSLFFFQCTSAWWKMLLNRLGLCSAATACFVVGVMNCDGSSLYFDTEVSGSSNKSAAISPSSPRGSTIYGLS